MLSMYLCHVLAKERERGRKREGRTKKEGEKEGENERGKDPDLFEDVGT